MSEEKRIELEIGWCKIIFALFAAIDVSLLGWLAQNYSSTDPVTLLLSCITITLITIFILMLNIYVFKSLKKI